MIGYLRGILLCRNERDVIILVGGVGYRVTLLERASHIHPEEKECALFISSYSRDGAVELYGFDGRDDVILFERLLSVSGVGPKIALAILRLASTADICASIAGGDVDVLKKVAGIGGKTAERIIVELKQVFAATAGEGGRNVPEEEELADALVRLGYSPAAARAALRRVSPAAKTPEEKIKEALKCIS